MKLGRNLIACAAVLFSCAALWTAPARAAATSCLPATLQNTLAEITQRFGPIRVVSAHRPGARVAGSGRRSYHASCRAIDFDPPQGKYTEVAAWLKASHKGGVGTYSCGMHHIHIDNGPRVRFHKCEGGGRFVARTLRHGRSYAGKSRSRRYADGRGANKRRYASRSRNEGRSAESRSRGYAAGGAPRGRGSRGTRTADSAGGILGRSLGTAL